MPLVRDVGAEVGFEFSFGATAGAALSDSDVEYARPTALTLGLDERNTERFLRLLGGLIEDDSEAEKVNMRAGRDRRDVKDIFGTGAKRRAINVKSEALNFLYVQSCDGFTWARNDAKVQTRKGWRHVAWPTPKLVTQVLYGKALRSLIT